MEFSSQFPKSFFDVCLRRIAVDTQDFIIIFILQALAPVMNKPKCFVSMLFRPIIYTLEV